MREEIICETVVQLKDPEPGENSLIGYFNVITWEGQRYYHGIYDSLVEAVKELPFDYFRTQVQVLQKENAALREKNDTLKRYNG